MKKIFVILFLCQLAFCEAQELEYKYVRVPEKFEFLEEENKYQLNALTAFLFEKYGFEVLYKKNVPNGVNPCEVLNADVESNSGIFISRLKVHLRNCNQEVVFSSEEGVSREKDYKKSYHEALRKAFGSVETFASEMSHLSAGDKGAETDQAGTPEEIASELKRETSAGTFEEQKATRTFINGSQEYQLKPEGSGFALFKLGLQEKFAVLLKSGSGTNYIYTSKNLQGNAFFDGEGNLIVEYVDPNLGQLISIKYELHDQ